MKQAKTNKNAIKILSAIISAVFAFIVGVTYCVTSLDNLKFGNNPKSTQAYFANQQIHVVNDTIENPILYGNNTNSFEVAIQYSIDYDFDLRLKYSLQYTDGSVADNVVLNFANRDNVIFDGEYIFIANSVQAGTGKIPLIVNVEFADSDNSNLIGKRLKIIISDSDIKFYKASTDVNKYDTNHNLYKDVSNKISAQAWLKYKKNKLSSESTTASTVMYNYRRNKAHGVPFPGVNTAYKKPVSTVNDADYVEGNVYNPAWTGGNTAFAGIGMYVISGSNSIRLKVQVAGIWRMTDSTDTFISENNVKFNYTTDWSFNNYSANKLWEVRTFSYDIPAKTGCYIDILESIEITCAGMVETVNYDDYRLVANSIILTETSSNTRTIFSYNENSDRYIQFKDISSTNYSNLSPAQTAYSQNEVQIVNSTKYSGNLYDVLKGDQTFKSGVVLINNSSNVKQVKANVNLAYSTSNASVNLFNPSGDRATSFDEDVFFKKVVIDGNNRLDSAGEVVVKLEPYASVTLMSSFDVSGELKNDLLFDDASTANLSEYYDVWTSLNVELSNETVQKTNLSIVSSFENGKTVLSVKNNSNKTISGVEIENLQVLEAVSNYVVQTDATAPFDWQANFWQYYKNQSGNYVQLTQLETYQPNMFYKKIDTLSVQNLTYMSGFELISGVVKNTTISLKQGEKVKFAECSAQNVIINGFAKAVAVQASTSLDLVDSGKNSAYLINNSETSCFVRFSGTLTQASGKIYSEGGYNYYIGVVVPGQIVNVSMSSVGTLDVVVAPEVFNESVLTDWSAGAKEKMNKYFNIDK